MRKKGEKDLEIRILLGGGKALGYGSNERTFIKGPLKKPLKKNTSWTT